MEEFGWFGGIYGAVRGAIVSALTARREFKHGQGDDSRMTQHCFIVYTLASYNYD